MYLDDPVKVGLGSSVNGILETKLPQGAIYDSYKLSIEVQIYDNEDGYVIYTIPTQVIVKANIGPNFVYSDLFTPKVLNDLYSGDQKKTMETILSITSIINGLSLSDKMSLNSNENSSTILTSNYGPLSTYSGVNTVSDYNKQK